MRKTKMSKPLSTLFAIGCLLSTGGPFFSRFLISMPDALTGFLTGFGIALMILVLIRHRKGVSSCTVATHLNDNI